MNKRNIINCVTTISILCLFMVMASASYAKKLYLPPQEDIPADISTDIKGLIEKLYSSEPTERGYAAYDLGRIGKRAAPAVPYLLGVLGDDSSIRLTFDKKATDKDPATIITSAGIEAAKTLGKIRDSRVVKPLIDALKYKDWEVRWGATLALGEIRDRRAVLPLITILRDKDPEVRWGAADALGKIGDSRAVKPLLSAMKEEDWMSQLGPSLALDKINPSWRSSKEAKEAVPNFLEALHNDDERIRGNAASALGETGDSRVVEPLIAAVKDPSWETRWKAAEALGKMGDQRAIKPLIEALKDEVSPIREQAAWALGKMNSVSVVEPLIATLKDPDLKVRRVAALALGETVDKRAIKPLIALLNDDSEPYVKSAAAEAL